MRHGRSFLLTATVLGAVACQDKPPHLEPIITSKQPARDTAVQEARQPFTDDGQAQPATGTASAEMYRIAADITRDCPIRIGNQLEVNHANAYDDNSFVLAVSILHLKNPHFDTTAFKKRVKPGMVHFLQSDKDFYPIMNNNATFVVKYVDENNKPICSVRIGPKDYYRKRPTG
jgi:hypothetical protein